MSTASLDDARWRQAEVVLLDIGKSHRFSSPAWNDCSQLHQPREACKPSTKNLALACHVCVCVAALSRALPQVLPAPLQLQPLCPTMRRLARI
jgi:hypothetical protein